MVNTLEQIMRAEQLANGSLHRPLREQLVAARKNIYIDILDSSQLSEQDL